MDGAAAPAVSADREHLMLVKVLQLAQQPAQKLSVANVGEFLDGEANRIAGERSLEDAVMFLAAGWRRSEEGGVVPSTWDGIAPLQEAVLTASLPCCWAHLPSRRSLLFLDFSTTVCQSGS